MTTLKWKMTAAGLAAGLTLATGVYAQMAPMKGMTHKGGMGMMGSMKMTGTMNGQPCKMQCGMMGGNKMMDGKGMMGKGMKMTKPMKMDGTVTTMGQTYHCTMTMTPQSK